MCVVTIRQRVLLRLLGDLFVVGVITDGSVMVGLLREVVCFFNFYNILYIYIYSDYNVGARSFCLLMFGLFHSVRVRTLISLGSNNFFYWCF